MNRKFMLFVAVVFMASLLAAGCAKRGGRTDFEAGTDGDGRDRGAETRGDERGMSGERVRSSDMDMDGAASAVEAPEEIHDVFFAFDQYTLGGSARSALEANAAFLKKNRGINLRIEGHCDERGSTEYNVALGDRRVMAVKRYLNDLGVSSSRITTVSYGEQKPFCSENNESCWQQNRRAHFTLR